MASQCALAAGDLGEARRLGEGCCDLPFYREEDHLATSRLIVVGLLSGAWDEALELCRALPRRAGSGPAGRSPATSATAPYAAATIHALRGNDDARADWMDVVETLETPGRPLEAVHFGEFFDALVLLHRGQAEDAVALLADPPEDVRPPLQRHVARLVRLRLGRGSGPRAASGGGRPVTTGRPA